MHRSEPLPPLLSKAEALPLVFESAQIGTKRSTPTNRPTFNGLPARRVVDVSRHVACVITGAGGYGAALEPSGEDSPMSPVGKSRSEQITSHDHPRKGRNGMTDGGWDLGALSDRS